MDSIFWIITIIVDVFFLIFALARASANYESEEKKLELEEAISNVSTVILFPLIAICSLISTISILTSFFN